MRTFSITDVGMVRQVNQDYVFEGGRPLGILRNLLEQTAEKPDH